MRLRGQRVEGGCIGLLDGVRTEGDRLAEMPAGEPSGFGGRDHFVRTRRIGHPSLGDGHPILAEVHAADTADLRHVVVVEGGGESLPVGSEGNHQEIGSIGDVLHMREACELPDQRGGAELIRDGRGLRSGGSRRSSPPDRPGTSTGCVAPRRSTPSPRRPPARPGGRWTGSPPSADGRWHGSDTGRRSAGLLSSDRSHRQRGPMRLQSLRGLSSGDITSTSVVQPRSATKGVSLTAFFVSAPRAGLLSSREAPASATARGGFAGVAGFRMTCCR